MKKTVLISCIIAVGLLGGCSLAESEKIDQVNQGTNQTKQVDKQEKVADDLNKPVVVDGIELTVKQEETTDMKKGDLTNRLYSFSISGKNISTTKKGLGAIDFLVKTTNGKKIKVDDSLETFGNEIEKDKTITGRAYFSVGANEKVSEIEYKPADDVLMVWKIK
ncbi:hypothetical protein HCA69_10535 [Listeria grandensis]|uniref:DUF4352 domain-containing protein n=1 Tax=Listeria grandensis TaxID=1494963 RepID=A0A7X1CQ89_9LIST|nr:hypothetical protein [Listeria grandensis]MBC1936805.1 hypothetical protein [Listeria grandensis]